jgi:hypothetical protein
MAKTARSIDIAPWLFCTKAGEGYFDESTGRPAGWNSMWQRFMTRLLKETKIKSRFTEHDLRRKVGSDAESLERAPGAFGTRRFKDHRSGLSGEAGNCEATMLRSASNAFNRRRSDG